MVHLFRQLALHDFFGEQIKYHMIEENPMISAEQTIEAYHTQGCALTAPALAYCILSR